MHRIPLRTAVIAGTCAVALSFVAVPAYASGHGSDSGGGANDPSSATTAPAGAEDDGADDSTTASDDDSAVDSADDSADDTSDDSSDADEDSDDSGADDSSLPSESGRPRLRVEDSTLDPAVFAKKGVTVTFTGLTPRASYQPYWSTAAMGDTIGKPIKADKRGALTFTWKPGRTRAATGTYSVGLSGEDTDLDLRKTVEVKYGSDITWESADRHGRKVRLTASVDRDGSSGKDTAWKKVEVDFQKKVGTTWVTVTSVRTGSDGVATATVSSGVQTWRAAVDDSATVFGDHTPGTRR